MLRVGKWAWEKEHYPVSQAVGHIVVLSRCRKKALPSSECARPTPLSHGVEVGIVLLTTLLREKGKWSRRVASRVKRCVFCGSSFRCSRGGWCVSKYGGVTGSSG